MPSNQFEDKIREKFEHAKIAPSPEVWAQLSGRLQEDDRKGFILPLFKWGAMGTVAAAACLGMWLMTKSVDITPGQQPMAIEETPTAKEPATSQESAQVQEQLSPPIKEPLAAIKEPQTAISPKQSNVVPQSISTSTLALAPLGAKIRTFERTSGGVWPERKSSPFAWEGFPNVRSQTFGARQPLAGSAPIRHLEPAISSSYSQLTSASPIESQGVSLPVTEVPRQILPTQAVSIQAKRKGGPRLSYGLTAMSLFQVRQLSSTYVASSLENAISAPPVGLDIRQVATDVNYPTNITGLALKMEYLLNAVFSVETGIGMIKAKTAGNRIPFSSADRTTLLATMNSLDASASNRLDYHSLAIPLLVNMRLGPNKHKLKMSLGLLSEWLVSQEPTRVVEAFTYINTVSASTGDFNTVNIQGQTNLLPKNMWNLLARLEYEYYICDRFSVGGGPTLSYALQPSFTYGNQKGAHGLTAGFDIGVSFFPKL